MLTYEFIDKSLVCPACKGRLIPDKDKEALFCTPCRRLYPIRDGIPVMLLDEALKTQGQEIK